MNLHAYFEQMDSKYDPSTRLLSVLAATPGYHTRIPQGTLVRPTRESMDYALALLQCGESWRVERACDIMDVVAGLQVTDPMDYHYGIWGWFYEEPPAQMHPADWNWADFIGARLAQALVIHGGELRENTRKGACTALRHAALSIFRRNVGPSYTNIALMGAMVSAVAGELLGLEDMLAYARRRLVALSDLAQSLGGFTEYNSPTYTRSLSK